MFGWLRKKPDYPKQDNDQEFEKFRDAVAIDVSGPEFFDFYPTLERAIEIFRETGVVNAGSLTWMADIAAQNGWDGKAAIKNIVRAGRLLGQDELRDLGLRANRKVGEDFVRRITAENIGAAIREIESAIHFASSEARHLHNLRRSAEVGVTHVVFLSAQDERNTELEKELDGKRMPVEEARRLVHERGREIVRSIFRAEIR